MGTVSLTPLGVGGQTQLLLEQNPFSLPSTNRLSLSSPSPHSPIPPPPPLGGKGARERRLEQIQ